MHNVSEKRVLDLAGVDWQKAWEEEEARRQRPADASHWSKRSKTYGSDGLGEYEREFIERSGIRPGDTVLDFGCGVGLLAIPLAKMGCRVLACDFSAGMLESLALNAQESGVSHLVQTKLLSWDDDWEAAGILPDSVDVAIASRSLATRDLLGAVAKLDRTARRRVCATVAAGRSPRRDERAFEALGMERPAMTDYAYCLNVLFEHGVFPELSYIVTHSRPAFADRNEALASLSDMVGGNLDPSQLALLEAFLDEHYSVDPDAHPSRAYAADALREVRWAFVSW